MEGYNQRLGAGMLKKFVVPGFLVGTFALVSILYFGNEAEVSAVQNASAGSSVYSASISNNGNVDINIVPSGSQQTFTSTDEIIFNSTCSDGATVSINTDSESNDLVDATGDVVKTIPAMSDTGLGDNTWGYKIGDELDYHQVPILTSPEIIYSSTSAETDKVISVVYGVRINNGTLAGVYTNNIVYTVAVRPECIAYTLKLDLDGGTPKEGVDYGDKVISYGATFDLANYLPTKEGYIFDGWTNGVSNFVGDEVAVDVNSTNAKTLTLKAIWVPVVYDFPYTGSYQTFTAPVTGYWKLETWGAQGGAGSYGSGVGGYGAYATGTYHMEKNTSIYAYVGGVGGYGSAGFNGGGYCYGSMSVAGGLTFASGSGGTDFRTTINSSYADRILVAGGGGGASGATGGSSYGYGGNTTSAGGGWASAGVRAYYNASGATGGSCAVTNGRCYQAGTYSCTYSSYNAVGTAAGGGGYTGGRGVRSADAGGTSSGWNYYYPAVGEGGKSYVGGVTDGVAIAGNSTITEPGGESVVGHRGSGYARATFLGKEL